MPRLTSVPPPAGEPVTGSSFGYSSCLKWGYGGSIDVAAFNVAQAADVLGLDLTKVRRRRHSHQMGGVPASNESWGPWQAAANLLVTRLSVVQQRRP